MLQEPAEGTDRETVSEALFSGCARDKPDNYFLTGVGLVVSDGM